MAINKQKLSNLLEKSKVVLTTNLSALPEEPKTQSETIQDEKEKPSQK